MLRLVPSQQAVIGRVETYIQRGVTWLLMIGGTESGKSTLIAHWPGTQEASWLSLRAADVPTPHDLAAACAAHWPSTQARLQELGWKTQLTQLQIPSCPSLPHVVIDDADQLTLELLAVISALTRGSYGIPWTILLVGAPQLIENIARACPECVTPSTVRLPVWDARDLLMVCPEALSLPGTVRQERLNVDAEGGIPQWLATLRAPIAEPPVEPVGAVSRPIWRRPWAWVVAGVLLILAVVFAVTSPPPAVIESQRVPLPVTPR